jgi:hypothetical protein
MSSGKRIVGKVKSSQNVVGSDRPIVRRFFKANGEMNAPRTSLAAPGDYLSRSAVPHSGESS